MKKESLTDQIKKDKKLFEYEEDFDFRIKMCQKFNGQKP